MNQRNKFRYIVATILLIGIASLTLKMIPLRNHMDNFFAEERYEVTYRYFYKTNEGKTVVKAFLPKNNKRQRISAVTSEVSNGIKFKKTPVGTNIKGVWTSTQKNHYEQVDFRFTFEGKSKQYKLPEDFSSSTIELQSFLAPSKYIQSQDPAIEKIAKTLKASAKNDQETVKAIFDFVYSIPSAPIITLTDAVTVLEQNRASCNGKSRLLVALARNLGYPARIKGGIILEEANKRTSHAWGEISINDQWIPFDGLNGHFASLPPNYLEIYEGDEFLVTHTLGIHFDYTYEIHKQNNIPFLNIGASEFQEISAVSLWGLIEKRVISMQALTLLLMLPIGGLLVAFLRNVVGLKTFGVFLPVLIAFSLIETGFVTGMLLFVFLILFVGIVSKPFTKLGLLHTPKLVISLTLMVLVMVVGSYIGTMANLPWLTTLTFFPTIILTVSAERFSTLIIEDGFQKASATLLQTLIAVSFCYFMLSSQWLPSIIIVFPELLLILVALAMMMGRYIGLRWTELIRFRPLLTLKNA